MISNFHQLLDKYRVERGADFTHTSLGYPKGSYFIPNSEFDNFMACYSHAACDAPHQHLFMTEKHKDVSPIVIDLDFKFNGCDTTRRYNENHVQQIIITYVKVIASILNIEYPVRAVVLEKPNPVLYNGGVKDGLHIIFPDIVTPCVEQFMIRADVLRKISYVLDDLRPSNPWSDVIDDAVISRNNWMMYGSRKPNCEPYQVTMVFDIGESDNIQRVVEEHAPSHDDYVYWSTKLSIRNKFATVEPLESRRSDLLAFEEAMNVRALQSANKKSGMSHTISSSRFRNGNEDYEIARKLVPLLNTERADSYISWIKVGWCLYNIDERLLTEWIGFSKKSKKYKEGECERLWSTCMREDALSMGSLCWWAKRDSPVEFADINKQRILSLINRSCNNDQPTHHDVAVVIHAMYRHNFACASIRSRTWYEFRDHRWRVSDSAYTLRRLISTEVYSEYVQAGMYFQERASLNAREEEEVSQCDSQKCLDRVKKINAAALKLKSVSFKDSLIKELSELFFQEGFEEKLNSKPELIGFENGVYDLDTNTFRDGQPEDYVSFSTGYDYEQLNESCPAVCEINEFFEKVFRSKELRVYVIRTLASCLHGGIRYERYNMWHGEQGANGKSKLLDLIEQTFGDYSVKFPVSLLTQKRVASNAATSELARSKGRRFASMQEPGENETLNIGIMKELSGNDKIVARHLFHEAIEFRPFYKMFMCCNHLPNVPSQDGGTWRRIRVVHFKSRFCENPDPSNPNEFKVDYAIDRKFDVWRPQMMSMLIKILPSVRSGIVEPSEVLDYTMNYKRSNDSITEFLDTFVRPGSVNDSVTLSELIRDYRQWRKREGSLSNNNSTINRTEFKSVTEKFFGGKSRSRTDAWFGYRLLSEEEEAEEARLAAESAKCEKVIDICA